MDYVALLTLSCPLSIFLQTRGAVTCNEDLPAGEDAQVHTHHTPLHTYTPTHTPTQCATQSQAHHRSSTLQVPSPSIRSAGERAPTTAAFSVLPPSPQFTVIHVAVTTLLSSYFLSDQEMGYGSPLLTTHTSPVLTTPYKSTYVNLCDKIGPNNRRQQKLSVHPITSTPPYLQKGSAGEGTSAPHQ